METRVIADVKADIYTVKDLINNAKFESRVNTEQHNGICRGHNYNVWLQY